MAKNKPKFAVLATVSPVDTARMGMLLDYASVASAVGYDALVFLALDSVLLVKKQVFEKLDNSIKEKFKNATELGVKFVACSSAVQGFSVREFINDRVEIWGAASFFEYASNSKLTLSI
ncbi:MAG: DsrE family protein [Conexivisphaerales archaeon]